MPDMDDAKPSFKQIQYAFTRHVRNPAKFPRPADIEARRMKIYNELLFINVEDFMAIGFPVFRSMATMEGSSTTTLSLYMMIVLAVPRSMAISLVKKENSPMLQYVFLS